MNNKKIAKDIFKSISKKGFIPFDIQYGNGYFIIDMGENSVVHFRVRGLRGWLFGIWIGCDEEYPVHFFTQHEDWLDKFKPSRSFFCIDYTEEEIKEEYDNKYFEIVKILSHIKNNPIAAYEQGASGNAYSSKNYYIEYVKDKYLHYKRKYSERIEDIIPIIQHKFRIKLLEKSDIVDHVQFTDSNQGGWKCSPRYEMIIYFKNMYDEEKQTSEEWELLRKYFKKELHDYCNIAICCKRLGENIPYSYTFY